MPGSPWCVLDDQVGYPRPAGGADDCSRILRCPPLMISGTGKSMQRPDARVQRAHKSKFNRLIASNAGKCLSEKSLTMSHVADLT